MRFIDWMNDKKLGWVTWSVSDKNEACSVLNASASGDGGWSDKDIKESGLNVRAYLREMQYTDLIAISNPYPRFFIVCYPAFILAGFVFWGYILLS